MAVDLANYLCRKACKDFECLLLFAIRVKSEALFEIQCVPQSPATLDSHWTYKATGNMERLWEYHPESGKIHSDSTLWSILPC